MDTAKTNLLGLTREQLASFFTELGEKPFRARQLMKWVHQSGLDGFEAMTDISRPLRARLAEVAEIRAPEIVSCHKSDDGTRKWIVRVASGSCVETVFIPDGRRGTLCVSSQAGCALDCSFCSTGKQGFDSDLTAAEIIGQVWMAVRALKDDAVDDQSRGVTNVVMMGMGEPLLNFDNVMNAMDLMMDDLAYGLSKRRVTLSTSGVVPAMHRMIGRTDVSLAISLHAPDDALRSVLVPVNKKYGIQELLQAVAAYMDSLPDSSRVVTVEYTLIAGVNDSRDQARALARLLRNTPCKINLIPFNPFPLSEYRRPSDTAIRGFQTLLLNAGYNTTLRKTRGDDIAAACGQLVGAVNDRTRRSARYKARQADEHHQATPVRIIDPVS